MKGIINVAKAMVKRKVALWLAGTVGVSGGLLAGLILVVIIMVIGIAGGSSQGSVSAGGPVGNVGLSAEVLSHQAMVEHYAAIHGVSEHVPYILAIMQQESGGRGLDPMQSSESYCGQVGCIQDVELSIDKGVLHFKNVLGQAEGDVKLLLQSYNFGGGFINYVKNRGGTYTFDKELNGKGTYSLAIQFSQEQYKKLQGKYNFTCMRAESKPLQACYGDILYVWAVMQYITEMGADGNVELIGGKAWPVPFTKNITSKYGMRFHPNDKVWRLHGGIDIAAGGVSGQSVVSFSDGVVTQSGFLPSSMGNYVRIDHGNGIETRYMHFLRPGIPVGTQVSAGSVIGQVGTTGNSTGPHLHFEIFVNGKLVDPLPYLSEFVN